MALVTSQIDRLDFSVKALPAFGDLAVYAGTFFNSYNSGRVVAGLGYCFSYGYDTLECDGYC